MKSERLSAEVVNTLYPVSGARVYRGAVVVKRLCTVQMMQSQKKKKKQVIRYLSRKSMNRFAFIVSTTEVKFLSLLTLSYGVNFPKNGRVVKADLSRMLTWLKRRYPGLDYFWFLEFQRRGAPHLHVGLSVGYPGRVEHNRMAMQWAKTCNKFEGVYSELARNESIDGFPVSARGGSVLADVAAQHRRRGVWENIRSDRGAVRYVLAYACKPHQKIVPTDYSNVGRFWGVSSAVVPGPGADFGATETEVRELMFMLGRNVSGFDVLPKYLFHDGDLTKEFEKYII